MKNLTLDQKIEIIKKYNSGETTQNLSIEYNIDVKKIRYFLKKSKEANWRGIRKYKLNEQYFDTIDTPEKAYWLGFICADGSVSKYGIRIELQKQDEHLLEKFKLAIESEHIIKTTKHFKNGVPNEKLYSKLDINSLAVANSLIKHNIKPNKTYNLEFPSCITDNLLPDFIRGLSDGDGHISCRSKVSVKYEWKFVGTWDLNKTLANKINSILDIKLREIPHPISSCVSILKIESHSGVIKFLDWIYKDAAIYLKRKHETYLKIKLLNKTRNKDSNKKLTLDQVKEIKEKILENKQTLRGIAIQYNVTHGCIGSIKHNKTYKDI